MKTTFYTVSMILMIAGNLSLAQDQANSSGNKDFAICDTEEEIHANDRTNVIHPVPLLKTGLEASIYSETFSLEAGASAVIAKVRMTEVLAGIYQIEVEEKGSLIFTFNNTIEPLFLKKKKSDEAITVVRKDILSDDLLVYSENEVSSTTVINVEDGSVIEHHTVKGITSINDLKPGTYILYTKPASGDPAVNLIRII